MKTLDQLTNDFLHWTIPHSVCADLCATKQQVGRVGTNLFSYDEAKKMLQDLVMPSLVEAQAEIERLKGYEERNECSQAALMKITKDRDNLRAELDLANQKYMDAGFTATQADAELGRLRVQDEPIQSVDSWMGLCQERDELRAKVKRLTDDYHTAAGQRDAERNFAIRCDQQASRAVAEVLELRAELHRLKQGIKTLDGTMVVDGDDMYDHGWAKGMDLYTARGENAKLMTLLTEWEKTAISIAASLYKCKK